METGAGTCATCGTENPGGARFCMGCGTALPAGCPACGEPAPPAARFCMSCGTALAAPAAAPVPLAAPGAPGPAVAADEQRRTVTVLFADLSGFTAVSERLDPEVVRSITERSLRGLAQEVERYGGTVDKFIGDNVMALFGAPRAHEDDPERAVRAGLAMQAAMGAINADLERSYGVRFDLRVGVNTGDVLAGAVVDTYTVIGDAVNVAARLTSAGARGSVTVGELTWRATRHCVAYCPLEPLALKGKADPVAAWEALELLTPHSARRGAPATAAPLVGREDELATLLSLYRRVAEEGRPHLVTVVGQAGVGKSRLLRELAPRLADEATAPVLRQGRCLAYGSGIVYWALGEVVRADCAIDDDDSAPVAWEKLSARLGELLGGGEQAQRSATLIGRLLGIEDPDAVEDAEGADDDAQRQRETFFTSVRTLMEGMARDRPLVLVFEDIHWADQGMLDLIEHVAQWARGSLLIVALARDELLERRSGWGSGRRATKLFLEPLDDAEVRTLVDALLPASTSAEAAAEVAERAGGNPFFAEEMARRLADERGATVAELPDTVHALLATRLDGLAPFERRLVQQAAVVGRTFWPDALAPLAAAEGEDLQSALDALRDKDIIVPGEGRRLAGEPELAFKHVLIRDVAYAMLPKAARARKHFEIGAFVEDRAGDRADEVVALLAEHYGRAAALGAAAQLPAPELAPMRAGALRFLEAAGDAAARFFSNEEAFFHYASALNLLGEDETDANARVADKQGDVALRLGRIDAALGAWRACLAFHRQREDLERIGSTLRKLGGALAQQGERREAIEHYQQGMNLLKGGPPSLELVRLYEDAAWLYVLSGDNMLAIYASEKALRQAQQLGEAATVSRAHGIFGRVFSRIGDAERARENLGRAVDLAREHDELEVVLAQLALGNHLEVAEADYGGAQATYADALALAQRIGDVPSQVELHAALAQLAVYRADWEAVQALSDASAELAEREGLVLKLCLPWALRGLLHWRAGEWAEAVARYRRAVELAEDVGWSEVAFHALNGLAIVLRDSDDHDGALEALDHALQIAERAGLTVQSIQGLANRAVVFALADQMESARADAHRAAELAGRLRSPVASIAVLEAGGASAPQAADAAERLDRAAEGWTALGRPLDAARCRQMAAAVLHREDPVAGAAAYAAAADAFERLGVMHLAARARNLAPAVEDQARSRTPSGPAT